LGNSKKVLGCAFVALTLIKAALLNVRFAPENRHAAAHWTGGGELDEDGNLYLPDLTPEQLHRRAMAQLILAVLALDS
jgi:hypothetical protein